MRVVFQRTLKEIQEKIRTRQYVMTLHAEEEMEDDGLTVFDIERCILTGDVIERQKDRSTGEWKYLIRGKTLEASEMVVAAKISVTGKAVIITVYRV